MSLFPHPHVLDIKAKAVFSGGCFGLIFLSHGASFGGILEVLDEVGKHAFHQIDIGQSLHVYLICL